MGARSTERVSAMNRRWEARTPIMKMEVVRIPTNTMLHAPKMMYPTIQNDTMLFGVCFGSSVPQIFTGSELVQADSHLQNESKSMETVSMAAGLQHAEIISNGHLPISPNVGQPFRYHKHNEKQPMKNCT